MAHYNVGKENPMYGKCYTLEERERLRQQKLGTKNPFYGKSHTRITKEKISQAGYGKKNPRWIGGTKTTCGYRARKIWEEYWNECIPRGYDIHHLDGDRTNHKISNLTMMLHGEHSRLSNAK